MKLSDVLKVMLFKGKSASERPRMQAINSVAVSIHLSKPEKAGSTSNVSVEGEHHVSRLEEAVPECFCSLT